MTAVRPETRPGGLGVARTSRARAGSHRASAPPRPSRSSRRLFPRRARPCQARPCPPQLPTGRRSPDPPRRRRSPDPSRLRPSVPPPRPCRLRRHPLVPPPRRRCRLRRCLSLRLRLRYLSLRCLIPRPSPTTPPRWAGTQARRRRALSPARPPSPGAAFPACPGPGSQGLPSQRSASRGSASRGSASRGWASQDPASRLRSAAARCPGTAAAR